MCYVCVYANIWAYMSCLCAHRARVCHAIIGIIARAPLSFEGESARIVFSVCVKRELSVHFALFSTKLDEPKSCGDNDATRFVQQEK